MRAVLENGVCTVSAGTRPTGTVSLDCGESGSTLRFLIPIAAALGIPAVFTGHGRLPDRPIGIYTELLPQHGVSCRTQGGLPLAIEGRLQPGCFSLPGNVSSQFITGLLLALPLLPEDSEICLTTPLESAAYVAMTVQAMDAFGVHVERTANGWHVPGQQSYRPCRHTVEGDWSQAAFLPSRPGRSAGMSPSGVCGRIPCKGTKPSPICSHRAGRGSSGKTEPCAARRIKWHGIAIDASQIPDLVPILAAAFSLAEGETVIHHAERLRLKESDRLAAMAEGLTAIGAQVEENAGRADPARRTRPRGRNRRRKERSPRGDGTLPSPPCAPILRAPLTDAGSIRKSYPDFFQDYQMLGGTAHGSIIRLGNEPSESRSSVRSHGPAVGVVIDGLPAGEPIDRDALLAQMARRAPGRDKSSTPRKEADTPEFLSGMLNGRTTGAPLCIVIQNTNTRSGDYANLMQVPRPGHSDYPAYIHYHGCNDVRGGGHFSGRLTSCLLRRRGCLPPDPRTAGNPHRQPCGPPWGRCATLFCPGRRSRRNCCTACPKHIFP